MSIAQLKLPIQKSNMRNRKRIAVISCTQQDENRELLNGIGKYISSSKDWDILVDNAERSVDDPSSLFNTKWDGVIHNHPSPKIPLMCLSLGIPCVDTSDQSTTIPGIPKIKSDNTAIGRLAAQHLNNLGCRSFAYSGYQDSPSSFERKSGFEDYLVSTNFDPIAFRSIETGNSQASIFSKNQFNPAREDTEIANLIDWVNQLPHSTSIFACDDWRARQLEKACKLAGLSIPTDISVLGVNNLTAICEIGQTTLSSIDNNATTRGAVAAKSLQVIFDGVDTNPPVTLIPPLEVVVRQSTDCSAVKDNLVSLALTIIRDCARDGLRVDDLVFKTNSSRRLLERRFKKYLGKTPNAAIREAQVAEIKRFLTHSDKSLSEIAYDTGFQNPEYMHVVFKREVGITPGTYRERHILRSCLKCG